MKSRQHFEGTLSAVVQERLKGTTNTTDEGVFMIDVFMAAAFFIAGVIQHGTTTHQQMNHIFARAERVRAEIEKAKSSASKGVSGGMVPDHGIDGNPLILPPGYEGN
jgi:hypothetical protein